MKFITGEVPGNPTNGGTIISINYTPSGGDCAHGAFNIENNVIIDGLNFEGDKIKSFSGCPYYGHV